MPDIELLLTADDLDDLVLSEGNGYCYVDLDLGFPSIRVDIEERNDVDGIDDLTEFFGSRAVSLSLVLTPTGSQTITELLDAITPFMSPRRRPFLHYSIDGEPTRRIRLRANALGAPLLAPFWQRARRVLLGWEAPDGVQELAELQTETINAAGEDEGGRSYPLEHPRTYPASSPVGAAIIELVGSVPVAPLIRLYGPCDDPRIENATTDQALIFDGLTLLAGEYVEIDVRERTVYLNGDSTQSRYHLLDFAASEWWELQTGENLVRYFPVTFSLGSQAVIMWRPAWL